MYLPIYSFCIFFMNWFNDYIFQGVWKNRIRNGIIIISKNNIPQNIWFFHNKFCGYATALFVISLSNSFMISSLSTWYKPKEKSELQFFFIAVMLGWNLYIMIAFINGLLMLWLIGFVSLYWRIHSFIMMLEKTSFNTDAVFLPFSTILSSSTKVIFWFETIVKAYPHPKISYYHTSQSHLSSQETFFYFFGKSIAKISLINIIIFVFHSSVLKEKVS